MMVVQETEKQVWTFGSGVERRDLRDMNVKISACLHWQVHSAGPPHLHSFVSQVAQADENEF